MQKVLPKTDIVIPEWTGGQTHPFSKTRHISVSRRDLRSRGLGDSLRKEFFLSILAALHEDFGKWVPFTFQTPSGQRSLDLGCLHFAVKNEYVFVDPNGERPIERVQLTAIGRQRVSPGIVASVKGQEEAETSSEQDAGKPPSNPESSISDTQTVVTSRPQLGDMEPSSQALVETTFTPSRGVFGAFGDRTVHIEDRPHHLYLAQISESPELFAGKGIAAEMAVLKIGITGDLNQRLRALNLSFPDASKVRWEFIKVIGFENRNQAAKAEVEFKAHAAARCNGESLGKEFFLLDLASAVRLLTTLASGAESDKQT
jgi:hypothetical protein